MTENPNLQKIIDKLAAKPKHYKKAREIPVVFKSIGKTGYAIVDSRYYPTISLFKWYGHIDKRGFISIAAMHHGFIHLHQIVWRISEKTVPKGLVIDHKNGSRMDNRLRNLQVIHYDQNPQKRAAPFTSKTGYKWVYPAGHGRKGYRVCMPINGETKDRGCYLYKIEGAKRVNQLIEEYHLPYKRLPVPKPKKPLLTMQQRRLLNKTSKSMGACQDRRSGNWIASVRIHGRRLNLGTYTTEFEAAQRWNQKATKYPNLFPVLNPVPEPKGKLLTVGQKRKSKQSSLSIGVRFNQRLKKFVAETYIKGKTKYVGLYLTQHEAEQAIKKYKKEHNKEYPQLTYTPIPEQNQSITNERNGIKKKFTWKRPHLAPVWNVATSLGISHTNLRRWIENGKLTKWTLLKTHNKERRLKGVDLSELAFQLKEHPRGLQRKLLKDGCRVVQYRE